MILLVIVCLFVCFNQAIYSNCISCPYRYLSFVPSYPAILYVLAAAR